MRPILFLTHQMTLGYGVSVAVHNLAHRLASRGYKVSIGCTRADATFSGGLYSILIVDPLVDKVTQLAEVLGRPLILANTSPFFEILNELSKTFECWALEYGDPTPSLFDEDRKNRERIKKKKYYECYPAVKGVLGISKFIGHDLAWPLSGIVLMGCNHTPDPGSKNLQDFCLDSTVPLRLGTLMRLGEGEARYKGNAIFLELCKQLKLRGVEVQPFVMGRGEEVDALAFQKMGMEVVLNGTDQQKWKYLRSLDIFVSCSLWEGFNLPLAEAGAIGTLAMAFDTGAHPEVTPFVLSNITEAVALIENYAKNRRLLLEDSKLCYQFMRERFDWEQSTSDLERLLNCRAGTSPQRSHRFSLALLAQDSRWVRSKEVWGVFWSLSFERKVRKILTYIKKLWIRATEEKM